MNSAQRRRYRLLWWSGPLVAATMLITLASGAMAQSGEAQITTPAPQSEVPLDEPFTVAGDGCPPGSTVTLEAVDVEAATTADDDGAFSTTLTLPASAFDLDAERFDVNEFRISGTCGDMALVSGTLVPDPESGEPTQVEEVPTGGVETGAGGAAETTLRSTVAGGVVALLTLVAIVAGRALILSR